MTEFAAALGIIAPYYNLVLVTITIVLFIKLFKTSKQQKTAIPWKVLFAALIVYIFEEVLTILRAARIIDIPIHINGFFELSIIALFIYAILKQKEISKL